MLLEVGMRLYTGTTARVTITRVTNKRAYAGASTEFDRDISNSRGTYRRGDKARFRTYYQLETPELLHRYNRAMLEYRYSNINVRTLSDEQLDKILAVVDSVPRT